MGTGHFSWCFSSSGTTTISQHIPLIAGRRNGDMGMVNSAALQQLQVAVCSVHISSPAAGSDTQLISQLTYQCSHLFNSEGHVIQPSGYSLAALSCELCAEPDAVL
ncbi:unnamed protein product [Bubo scandiacus]